MQNGTPHNRPVKPIKPDVESGSFATEPFSASADQCPLFQKLTNAGADGSSTLVISVSRLQGIPSRCRITPELAAQSGCRPTAYEYVAKLRRSSMRTMRLSLVLVSLSIFATLVATSAMSRSWQTQTASGQKVAAHAYCSGLNQTTCTETALPQIDVTAPPSGGTISFGHTMSNNVFTRVGEVRIGKQCPALPRHCVEIYYTPATGFRGDDHFSYTVSNANGQKWRDTLTVVVH